MWSKMPKARSPGGGEADCGGQPSVHGLRREFDVESEAEDRVFGGVARCPGVLLRGVLATQRWTLGFEQGAVPFGGGGFDRF